MISRLPRRDPAGADEHADARPATYRAARFETIFRDSPDGIVIVDAHSGAIIECNRAIRDCLGCEPARLITRAFDTLYAPLTKAQAPLVERVRLHGAVLEERELVRIDGSAYLMNIRAWPAQWDDRPVVIVTLRDVRDRRRAEAARRAAEAKYRSIFEHAVEGIFQTTPDGRYLSANPALARIYGYDSPDELIGRLTDIAGQLYVDPARRTAFRRLLEEEDVVREFESEIYRRDGSTTWIAENARAVRDANGRLRYYEGTVVDISARKHAEEAQRRVIDELARTNRLKSEFVASISHEFRTPLNILHGYHEMLLDEGVGALSDEQRDILARVQRTTRGLTALINATLDLSRLDAGKFPLEVDTTSIADLFHEVAFEISDLVRERADLEMRWDVSPAVPVVHTDAAKLKLVLRNLIDNAVKFTGRGRIAISAAPCADGVELAVEDTGVGIAADALSYIFEAFRQGDGSATRSHDGVGLGLHLVWRLVDLLGGTITVTSTVGVGSTFRVWLPLCPAIAERAP